MGGGSDLGQFLRSRRAQVRPADVGLGDGYGRRRVAGLRREEIAQLAGMSVAYYTRLEQGRSTHASDAVLDAIARALQLDAHETLHLRSLARPRRARPRSRPERLRPELRSMIDAFGDVPAFVAGRFGDVLAWNQVAHALLAGHLDVAAPENPADRPNLARLTFLDQHTRELYPDWQRRARDSVAHLRLAAGRHPGDQRLMALVGELTVSSPEFAALWSAHPIHECTFGVQRYRHPLVGELALDEEVMHLPGDAGQRLVVLNARPGSPSADALRLLVELSHRASADAAQSPPVSHAMVASIASRSCSATSNP
jgi:transcriptional regulator with XRE-family HTH domain